MTSSSRIWSLYGRGSSSSSCSNITTTVSTSFFSTSSSLFSSSSASSQRFEQRNLTEGRAERDATLRRCLELMEKSSQTLAPLITDTAPWIVSRIGLGTQRLHPRSSDHQKTAEEALLKLTNVVDTAVQYSSPDLIGSILSEFQQNKKLNRSSVVVVGRGGVFDPISTNSNLKVALDGFLSSSTTRSSFKKIGNKIFSLSPQAIELSIDDLTSRLQLKTIDFFLLQGPELLLGPAASLSEDEFYSQLRAAFVHLEKEVTNGRIGHYGIASPAFLYPTSSQKVFTLKKVLSTAQEVATSLGLAKHHFLGIQVPFNLVEGNLVRDSLFQEEVTKNGLVCLSHRPLTAQLPDDTWFELASYPKRDMNEVAGNLKQAFDVAIHMEKNFPLKNTAGEIDITWARKILASRSVIPDIVTWKRALSSMENPILATIKKMTENTTPEFIWHWQYQKALKLLTLCLTEAYEFNAQAASGRLNSRLEKLCPQLSDLPPKITESSEDIKHIADEETKLALPTTTTLSHRALRVAVSSGAHSVLLGVRSLSQIKEARGVAAQAPLNITQVKEILTGVASRSVTEPDLADSGLSDFGGLSVPPLPTFPKPK